MLGLALAFLLSSTAAPETVATPALEATEAPEPAQPPAKPRKAARSQSDVICREVTPVGTRFGKRICTTRSDWEERSRRDQEFIRTTRTAPTPSN